MNVDLFYICIVLIIIVGFPNSSYSVEWIHLAQDMDQWQDLMNTVLELRIP